MKENQTPAQMNIPPVSKDVPQSEPTNEVSASDASAQQSKQPEASSGIVEMPPVNDARQESAVNAEVGQAADQATNEAKGENLELAVSHAATAVRLEQEVPIKQDAEIASQVQQNEETKPQTSQYLASEGSSSKPSNTPSHTLSNTQHPEQAQNQPVSSASNDENMANQDSSHKPLTLAVGVLAVLLAAQWWSSNSEIRSLREELAKRLQNNDATLAEARAMAKGAQDGSKELYAKYSILENKQAEAQNQQLALEQLYQELSKSRDDWALAEVEQVLSTADQQLQLAGNVQGALIALQNADRSLSRFDKPQFIPIRRAITRDIDRLKVLPNLDLPGIAVRLDSVIGQVEKLPLLSDEKPAQAVVAPKKVAVVASKTRHKPGKEPPPVKVEAPSLWATWSANVSESWRSLSSEIWLDVQQLIRVRSVEKPMALMMSPEQAYFTRENLKLRLLNARLGLLSRNESAFRSDLIAAQDLIAKYFDTSARQTQNVQILLKAVQGSDLSIELPSLNESLVAVRNYKTKP